MRQSLKVGDRVWLSGDSAAMWIGQYDVRVDTGATVVQTPPPNAKKVMLNIDVIDHDVNVCAYVRRSACRKVDPEPDAPVRSWDAIAKDWADMERMSCVPQGIRLVKLGHVFDDDKPVKWNREKAMENNARYQEELGRLNTVKNKRRDRILEDIYRFIRHEVGHGLTREKARRIWDEAVHLSPGTGLSSVKLTLDSLILLTERLLED